MISNNKSMQVHINHNWESNSLDVWVIEVGATKQYNINIVNGGLEQTEISEMEPLKDNGKISPFLKLPWRFGALLFKSIAEYHAQNGVKTVDQNFTEGKLSATEAHLKDMQEFAKQLLDFTTKAKAK